MFSWRAAVLKVLPTVPEGPLGPLEVKVIFHYEVFSAFFMEQWFTLLVGRAPERLGWGDPKARAPNSRAVTVPPATGHVQQKRAFPFRRSLMQENNNPNNS